MGDRLKIVVVGTGYVGLPAALMLARAGHEVVGVDIDENVVRAINDGDIHIDEAELHSLMDDPKVRSNLTGTHEPVAADVFIIAVPTPLDPTLKQADLSMVTAALDSVVPVLRRGNLVIVESTIPPLTCRRVVEPLLETSGLQANVDFDVVHCPERILPGDIFREIVENDRIIGGATRRGREAAESLYRSFVKGDLLLTDDVTAELVKLMENTYRDVNVALANELDAVAATLGVDGAEAIRLANLHPRVDILSPGIGVGGHCIPIDPWFINQVDPVNAGLIREARRINDEKPSRVAARIREAVAGIPGPTIVAAGVSYKADTVDVRESPALEIIEELQRDGYRVVVHDPVAYQTESGGTLSDICDNADLLAILVPHALFVDELRDGDEDVRARMRTPRIVDYSGAIAPLLAPRP